MAQYSNTLCARPNGAVFPANTLSLLLDRSQGWPGSGVRSGEELGLWITIHIIVIQKRGPPCFGLRVGILIVCHCTPLNNIIPYLIIIVGLSCCDGEHCYCAPSYSPHNKREEDNGKSTKATPYLPLDGLQCTRKGNATR